MYLKSEDVLMSKNREEVLIKLYRKVGYFCWNERKTGCNPLLAVVKNVL